MCMVELATGKDPWHENKQCCEDPFVLRRLITEFEERPQVQEDMERDDYFAFMKKCWAQESADRPLPASIAEHLKNLYDLEVKRDEQRQREEADRIQQEKEEREQRARSASKVAPVKNRPPMRRASFRGFTVVEESPSAPTTARVPGLPTGSKPNAGVLFSIPIGIVLLTDNQVLRNLR